MKQYLDLLRTIKDTGVHKPAAREGMPGTKSIFGYQFRHNLADGFPLLTTKKMFWKGVVVELLWFLRGETNIKYLLDNGVNIWNEDAYNYYKKMVKQDKPEACFDDIDSLSFESFIDLIKKTELHNLFRYAIEAQGTLRNPYILGNCGYQYGRVWRQWSTGFEYDQVLTFEGGRKIGQLRGSEEEYVEGKEYIDQIQNLINSLKNTPESRRHIVTAIDPAHDTDLALYWCHAMMQFNCRPLTKLEKIEWICKEENCRPNDPNSSLYGYDMEKELDFDNHPSGCVPKYHLDCQLYQRSADAVLGVPFNIASYALLTHILAEICNMVPGEFIHTFGDVHIYDNHVEAVEEQLKREPSELPKLEITQFHYLESKDNRNEMVGTSKKGNWDLMKEGGLKLDEFINELKPHSFHLKNYNPQPAIKAELSTGLKK